MSRVLFRRLKRKFDPDDRVDLLLSSEDPELGRYLDAVNAIAATHMDAEGRITIKIHDARGVSKACWLEEMAHALQYLRDGNIPLSRESPERNAREVEVAQCLIGRIDRGRLSPDERPHLERALAFYGGEAIDG